MGRATTAPGAPPPPPGAVVFHVAVGGQSQGPYTLQQLADMIGQGTLTGETLVWSPGFAQWTPAAQVPALASQFGPPPPPRP
jgi:hypothetical protein